MKNVTETKLEELFTIAFNLGMSAGIECAQGSIKQDTMAEEYIAAMGILIADCNPNDKLSADVVKLRDSA